jgi:hypothetical protein
VLVEQRTRADIEGVEEREAARSFGMGGQFALLEHGAQEGVDNVHHAGQGDTGTSLNQSAARHDDLCVDPVTAGGGDEMPCTAGARSPQHAALRGIADEGRDAQIAASLHEGVGSVLLDDHHALAAGGQCAGQQVSLPAQAADDHVIVQERQADALYLLEEDMGKGLQSSIGCHARG